MSKLDQLYNLEAVLKQATKQRAAAQTAIDRYLRDNPSAAVGRCFVVPTEEMPNAELIACARKSAQWLAEQCVREGSGAAHDSGQARVVVQLEELCTRLENHS